MIDFFKSHLPLLLFAALWSLSYPSLLTAWSGISRSKPKDQLDPNVRDWGDYSDLPPGIEQGLGLDEEHGDNRGVGESSSSLDTELDFLADFAGKKRLWVITAPSHDDHYLRLMEKQLEEMEQKGLNCRLAERDTFIITIIQNAMMEGRIQKTTFQGDATVESLDPDTVSKLLHYLELTSQEQGFTMLVLKKNLRVSERFPYAVRVEAVLELIDHFPMRKLEKMTRKGSNLRCKTTKKKVVMKRKKIKKKMVPSPQRQGNMTSVVALQRKPPLDKKALLKSKIQDILSGRSRFVIRTVPAVGSTKGMASNSGGRATSNGHERVHSHTSVSKGNKEVKKDRPDSTVEEGNGRHEGKNREDKKGQNLKDDTQEKQSSKKKGKGNKGKKGKGRGKKSNRENSESDKTALKEFLDSLKGKRRLMLISTPSRDATLYIQQKDNNEKQHCDLAIRKITVATTVGSGRDATLTLRHHQLESEPPLSDQSEHFSDSGLVSVLRAEFGLSSSDLFSMTVTDYDIKPNRVFEAPPSSTALFEYIDNFPSRRSEKEKERRTPLSCSNGKQNPEAENSLLRFMSKRRLLLISAPSEDDYSFQQQHSAFSGQECNLGIRHFAMLKLIGTGDKASGTVELFPLNGRSQSEVEPLSPDMVNNLREQLKISKDYFSMLVVGKDSDVKAWFPSPMWSLDSIYDLVDSMELRLQEEKLQKKLGIHCPEDRGREGSEGGHYHSYDEDRAEETYLYYKSEE
ncbi:coiled-coil domain-containing protein 80 [Etheostoma cragini]|uniref:coiled-coil domain-containing protein 80 n=1 Tax=Etheostoma cragini TaxID=417921 RepID=UPI00155E075F|nr:coiled-coil domain-containing protein 80 [Etheostoma cragini]XP_034752794.1 coiled-coil domain-containing protein 80 [Etheostoma cragini]